MNLIFEKLAALSELINDGADIDKTLDYVFNTFYEAIPYDRIAIALLDVHGNISANSARVKNEPKLKTGFSLTLYDTSLRQIIESKQPRIINNYLEYLKGKPNSEATRLIVEEGIRSSLTCPLIASKVCVGVIFFSSKSKHAYTEKYLSIAKLVANYLAIAIEKNLLVDDLILASVIGFAKLLEAKDTDTGMHLDRIQNYSKVIAKSLAKNPKYKNILNEKYINNIYKFSPLHDIGKVGIQDSILLKPGRLTHEEFEIMKGHTLTGADVLKAASNNLLNRGQRFFDIGIEIALGHHEKFNGKGYPHGLKGEKIPLSARIVAAADVLDALASKRVYKNAFSFNTALQIIHEETGTSFDPDVVEALFEVKEKILEVYNTYREKESAVG